MSQSSDELDRVSAGLRKVLNTHGHSFQYAVLRHVSQMRDRNKTPWFFNRAEFPVIVNGETTHIDFVLQSRSGRTHLVAECKRVDPAVGHWCFVKAPYTWRNPTQEAVFDQFILRPEGPIISSPNTRPTELGPYHLGFEIKTGVHGEGAAHGGSAINQAVTQVLRSTSGWINHVLSGKRNHSETQVVRFIPAIFTTADVWTTQTDIGTADLTTGDLPAEAVQATKADWFWLNHNRSPHLRPDLEPTADGDRSSSLFDIAKEMQSDFARSIAVVSVDHIDNFLMANIEEWLV